MSANLANRVHDWSVVVGNLGTAYTGRNGRKALLDYNGYVRKSKERDGRVAGESVALLRDGEPVREYAPPRVETPANAPAGACRVHVVSAPGLPVPVAQGFDAADLHAWARANIRGYSLQTFDLE